MINELLFEIAIYSCSQEQWNRNVEKRFGDYVETRGLSTEQSKEKLEQLRHDFHSRDDIIWLYNGIIGWLRFVIENDFIVAHLYRINKKRISKIPKNKTFQYIGRRGKEQVDLNMSSTVIGNILKKMTDRISSRLEFKDRYIDRGLFDKVYNYVDWRKIILT
jgi:hypothetical protein